ncbi:hypothetical protein RclHR1_00890019 [Rhizophagus clarus]|uniref:Uncharacterized protein n=1 Tax=Rhizophagus clarus TaxID=94130 RepID=A0A2Z6S8P0_9GLOM|nr:hypothetical protein RclHR1_00890019 [Rhizophagus clarus]
MNTSQSRGYSPTAKFLSVSDKEMKEMIDHILEQRKSLSNGISMIGQVGGIIPGHGIAFSVIQKVLEYISEEKSLHDQILGRRIDRDVTKYGINTMKSNIDAIESLIKRLKTGNLTSEGRNAEHPLITSPFLIAFSQLYTTVCTYRIELDPACNKMIEDEKKRLKNVIEDYKINAIEERLKMIKVVQMLKVPHYEGSSIKDNVFKLFNSGNIFNNLKDNAKLIKLHEVDIVKDGFGYDSKQNELHYWDRTFWDQERQFTNNYAYPMVVKIEYEKFFDEIINTIY